MILLRRMICSSAVVANFQSFIVVNTYIIGEGGCTYLPPASLGSRSQPKWLNLKQNSRLKLLLLLFQRISVFAGGSGGYSK